LGNYGARDDLVAWIREHDSAEWGKYLDNITASSGLVPTLRAMTGERIPGFSMDVRSVRQ
jgi:hypothetical protein